MPKKKKEDDDSSSASSGSDSEDDSKVSSSSAGDAKKKQKRSSKKEKKKDIEKKSSSKKKSKEAGKKDKKKDKKKSSSKAKAVSDDSSSSVSSSSSTSSSSATPKKKKKAALPAETPKKKEVSPKPAKKSPKKSDDDDDVERSAPGRTASGTRITTIDPMARPKVRKYKLPEIKSTDDDDTPDWLFKPSEEKISKIGAFGITGKLAMERKLEKRASQRKLLSDDVNDAGASKESKKYANEFMGKLEKDKKLKKKIMIDKNLSPEEQLQVLLDHDPWDRNNRYDDEMVRDWMKKHENTAGKRYKFDAAKDEIYPFSMLCALQASEKTLKACYKAFPDAVNDNDNWVGTPLHYACAYRAPKATLKFIISKDEDDEMIESTNQGKRLPIHVACMVHTPLENLEYLIKEGGKKLLGVQDRDGMTPLHHLCNRTDPDEDAVFLLTTKYAKACVVQNIKGCTPLHLAVQHGTPVDILETLLAANDKAFSIADENGNLPAHTALQVNAERKIVQYIVWNYADALTVRNKRDERPIDMAKRIYKREKDLHEILEPSS